MYAVDLMANKDLSLPGLLLRARLLVASKFRKVFRAHGISPEQWRVLHSLNLEDSIEAAKLAERVDLTASSLSRILRDLQERGLLLKMSDQEDARRTLVVITRPGRSLVERVMGDVRVVFASITQKVGRAQIDALCTQLISLIDTLSEDDEALGAEAAQSAGRSRTAAGRKPPGRRVRRT